MYAYDLISIAVPLKLPDVTYMFLNRAKQIKEFAANTSVNVKWNTSVQCHAHGSEREHNHAQEKLTHSRGRRVCSHNVECGAVV
jgi:hypothetical protein